MRMLLTVHIPHEPFNQSVRDGAAGDVINQILEATEPQQAFFTEQNGLRTVMLIIEVNEAHEIPRFAEPWFLKFDADCEFRILMDAQDLKKADLAALGSQWA
ncbi:panthothenate synthetase [Crenobacter cavernae]|uniref:Panthothenate synthetase n=1 Tax=Crenobacter cavernae TaxID=2290923 RepID=A0A345Y4F3_9NEIS|nr:panthothenate synthetase [Crenobacter cavernae]AXK38805.1 panthothenate synthetase [Crenobacter cavernae]RXZ44399.1 panthothenate synthetase [Crenobacter cavernae]